MKITKFVVIGQLVASAGLLGAFLLRSPAVPAAAAASAVHGSAAAEAGHAPKPGTPAAHGTAKPGDEHAPADSDAEKNEHAPAGKSGTKGAHVDHRLGTDAKAIAKALLAGNTRFTTGHGSHPDLTSQRTASAAGQHPGAMVLGCADSRVPPELVFDRGIGELFVVRSAGNIAEPVAVGSLEYAAEHLHAKVLLVLGHEKCGAVQAALSEGKMPSPNLEAVVSHIAPAVSGLKQWAEGGDLVRMAVEANVRRQADEILRRSPMLRAAVAKGEIKLLKAVYDLETGRVRPL